MNVSFDGGSEYTTQANGGRQPLGERPDVRAEKGVECVYDAVMRAESAIRDAHESQACTQSIHHVWTWSWHFAGGFPVYLPDN